MDISHKTLQKMGLPFPDWHVVKEIGSGTFGSVYRIENRSGDICALKVIPVPSSTADLIDTMQLNGNDVQATRSVFNRMIDQVLKREIGTAKSCSGCPNVFRIYEETVVDDPNNPAQRYIMVRMELLMESKAFLNQPGTRQRDVMRMMENVANALAYMENRNILHRDIKPANIMVDTQGRFKVTDFGEARVMQKESSHTIARGTPYYMAPEVATSGHYDNRADIYSLGMVAYYFLNGQRYPFTQYGVRAREGYERRMKGEACPPLRGVDRNINRIVMRCIAFRPEERYARAADLVNDLRQLLRDQNVGLPLINTDGQSSGGGSVRRTPSEPMKKPKAKSPDALPTAAIVLLVIGGVLLFVLLAVLVIMLQ